MGCDWNTTREDGRSAAQNVFNKTKGDIHMQLMRGAYPTPKHKVAAAIPHSVTGATPPQFIRIPKVLSMWGNDVFGDCVTAEECFAKACGAGASEVFLPYGKAI